MQQGTTKAATILVLAHTDAAAQWSDVDGLQGLNFPRALVEAMPIMTVMDCAVM